VPPGKVLPTVTAGAVMSMPLGAHMGAGFVMTNIGVGFIVPTTLEVPTQPANVTVTVYKPLSADVAGEMVCVAPLAV